MRFVVLASELAAGVKLGVALPNLHVMFSLTHWSLNFDRNIKWKAVPTEDGSVAHSRVATIEAMSREEVARFVESVYQTRH